MPRRAGNTALISLSAQFQPGITIFSDSAVQLLAADYSRQESYSDAFNRRLTAPSHSSSPPRLESPAL